MLYMMNRETKFKNACVQKNKNVTMLSAEIIRKRVVITETEFKLRMLERNICQHEARVAEVVEACITKNIQRVASLYTACKSQICSHIDTLLQDSSSKNIHAVLNRLISERQVAELEQEIRFETITQFKYLFGIKSRSLAAVRPEIHDIASIASLGKAIDDYRLTISIGHTMLKASNKIWDKSVDKLNMSKPVECVFKKLELGNIFLSSVKCMPYAVTSSCKKQLEARLAGIVENICKRLLSEYNNQIAKNFYQMFDDVFAKEYNFEKAQLLEQMKLKRHSGCVPLTLYAGNKAV
ncbi:hypothetical protein [Dendrosporobacter sp. 1207_IL3150]|uniref:hypothetical protein n=1 Tax=Dendrosporobacter sp. 1207_IL3150 TaxID=3084054 RepID=UPI002FD89B20